MICMISCHIILYGNLKKKEYTFSDSECLHISNCWLGLLIFGESFFLTLPYRPYTMQERGRRTQSSFCLGRSETRGLFTFALYYCVSYDIYFGVPMFMVLLADGSRIQKLYCFIIFASPSDKS